jgi:hypothetical protein
MLADASDVPPYVGTPMPNVIHDGRDHNIKHLQSISMLKSHHLFSRCREMTFLFEKSHWRGGSPGSD